MITPAIATKFLSIISPDLLISERIRMPRPEVRLLRSWVFMLSRPLVVIAMIAIVVATPGCGGENPQNYAGTIEIKKEATTISPTTAAQARAAAKANRSPTP